MHAPVDGRRIGQRAGGDELLKAARRRLAPRPWSGERSADGGLHQLRGRAIAVQQVAAQAQLGHQRAADRGRVVDDSLADALLHTTKLPHLTPHPKLAYSGPSSRRPTLDVKTLAVVGAGQMGAGIAQVAAQSGL